jgi:diguanylate cyclase (GGDEF)-like protein
LDSKEKENQILAARNELQNIKLITETQKNEVLQLLFLAALIILTLLAILIYRTRKHKLRFQYLANHDGLTGLYNRNYILEKLKAVFHESSGMKHKLNIAMIDLDHFKSINDTYGHHIGDKVLKQLALIFKSCLTENDCCGRFGGEEFLLVLPHKSLEKAIEQLNQIRIKTLEISQVLKLDNKSTSLSVGVCHVNHDSSRTSIDEWIKCSDDALYQAKSKGRNTIVVGI